VPLPFRQQDLADALGLSLVHTNKTLARFRERQLCDWSEGVLRILDASALATLGLMELDKPDKRPLM
jgi:CRP-like cAMP-binding protein